MSINLNSFLRNPITGEPFQNAVVLSPCGHTIEKTQATSLFGKINFKGLVSSKKTCPICNNIVAGYSPNVLINNIIKELFESNFSLTNNHKDFEIKTIPAKTPKLKEEDPNYPGERAIFKLEKNDLGPLNFKAPFLREIQLKSESTESLIQECTLCGYTDGKIMLIIDYLSSESKKIEKYFEQSGVTSSPIDSLLKRCCLEKNEKIQLALNIIANNNTIPEDALEQMKEMIEENRKRNF